MSNTVTGTGKPLIQVYDGTVKIWDFLLPLTNEGGLVEDWEEQGELVQIQDSLTSWHEEPVTYGLIGNFSLDYSNVISRANIVNIGHLFEARTKGYTFWLTPRINVLARRFKVNFTTKDFILALKKQANGHKGAKLDFRTVDLYDTIPMFNPDDLIMVAQYCVII